MPVTSRLIDTGRSPDIPHQTPLLMLGLGGELVFVHHIRDGKQYGVVVGSVDNSFSHRLGFRGSYWTELVPYTGSVILENKEPTV
jgi:hypothetical protein